MSGASMPHRLIADSVFLRFLNVRVTKVAARRMSAAEQVRWSRAREPIQNSMAFKTNCMRFGVPKYSPGRNNKKKAKVRHQVLAASARGVAASKAWLMPHMLGNQLEW